MREDMIYDVMTVDESQLPAIVTEQFGNLTELENNIQRAVDLATSAKQKAQSAQVSAGWFKKEKAINLLQDAANGLADAQISSTEAQTLLFEYQTKLTEITKYLFGLGVSNLAMNRSVVRELELKLQGASEEELSDLAKQELKTVILQLKAQEDMMKKQEFLTGKVKEQAGQIKAIDHQLDEIEETDDEQNEKIAENTEKITKHAKVLSAHRQKDDEHDKKILVNSKIIAEHADALVRQQQKDEALDKIVGENSEKIVALEFALKQQMQAQEVKNNEFDERVTEFSKSLSKDIADLRSSVSKSNDAAQDSIAALGQRFDSQILEVRMGFEKKADGIEERLGVLSKDIKNVIGQLEESVAAKNLEVNNRLNDLESRITALDAITSKKLWKLAVSVAAILSLIISLLQVFSII